MTSKATVLIVEDNADDLFLLLEAFRRANISARLQTAPDAFQAKAYLAGEGAFSDRAENPMPDLALVDLKMPGMSGFDLLQWVRSQSVIKRLPVVVLTSSDRGPDVNRAYDLGANSYLVKPSQLQDLVGLVESVRQYWIVLNRRPECHDGSGQEPEQ